MKCEYCGAEFELVEKRGLRKYCSVKCRNAANNAKRESKSPQEKNCPICENKSPQEKNCPICAKPFTPVVWNQIYCSAKCRKQAEYIKKRDAKVIPELPTFPPPKVEVKPPEPPPPPKVIIPAAIAENREPTVEELLDWIFSKERSA